MSKPNLLAALMFFFFKTMDHSNEGVSFAAEVKTNRKSFFTGGSFPCVCEIQLGQALATHPYRHGYTLQRSL